MQAKVGDVVQLKSGGPKMTVLNIEGREIWCTWFDDQKKPQRQWFAPEMLEPVVASVPVGPMVVRTGR